MRFRSSDSDRSRGSRLLLAAAVCAACLGTAGPLTAQEQEAGSVLAAGAGGLVGVVAGGYANLAIVVMKARFGRYPHSFEDAFGWESAPILIGGATGAAIGLLDRDLIIPWIIGGTTGFAAGAGVGYIYGQFAWGDSESRWANAAITSAVGMAIGSTVALIRYSGSGLEREPEPGPESAIRVPLVQLRF